MESSDYLTLLVYSDESSDYLTLLVNSDEKFRLPKSKRTYALEKITYQFVDFIHTFTNIYKFKI